MTAHPLRVRRASYTEKLAPGTVLVARPSRYGNPFRVILKRDGRAQFWVVAKEDPFHCFGEFTDYKAACAFAAKMHAEWLIDDAQGRRVAALAASELRGKRLACYCPLDQPCHADNLAMAANKPTAA